MIMCSLENNIHRVLAPIDTFLQKTDADILKKYSVEKYLGLYSGSVNLLSYGYVGSELNKCLTRICNNYGSCVYNHYQKAVILKAMLISLKRFDGIKLPEIVFDLYLKWFLDVVKGFSFNPDSYYDHRNDCFMKDLSVCCLRSIPIGGAWIVEMSGISKSYILSGNIYQTCKSAADIFLKVGGFKPLYLIHAVKRYVSDFNVDERGNCNLRIAELLKLYPHVRGMFGTGWLYDPHLEKISPRLSYLRKIPEENGAFTFRIGSSQRDINNSISKSSNRLMMYRSGDYLPTSYCCVWPREAMIRWADNVGC
jgi:hypothetical protein